MVFIEKKIYKDASGTECIIIISLRKENDEHSQRFYFMFSRDFVTLMRKWFTVKNSEKYFCEIS